VSPLASQALNRGLYVTRGWILYFERFRKRDRRCPSRSRRVYFVTARKTDVPRGALLRLAAPPAPTA